MRSKWRTACGAVILSILTVAAGHAQRARQNTAGQFEFYVLALSWSPSYCEATAERRRDRRELQCGQRPYSFVVHGLWPQHERGFPEYCQVPAPRLDRNIVALMLDLMPAPRLIFHEWDRHGTCSGLSPRAYFETVRKARAVVQIPNEYVEIKEALMVTPSDVEAAFIRVNPGLSPGALAVTCDNRRLREVRICLSRELRFRDCSEIDRRACRRERLVMPPVRGG